MRNGNTWIYSLVSCYLLFIFPPVSKSKLCLVCTLQNASDSAAHVLHVVCWLVGLCEECTVLRQAHCLLWRNIRPVNFYLPGELRQNFLTPSHNTTFILNIKVCYLCILKTFIYLLTELDGRRNSRDQTHTHTHTHRMPLCDEPCHRVRSAQHSTFCWSYTR
jgi:hypothetical protein